MARRPEKSDPDIEVCEISLEDISQTLANSGVHKIQDISEYAALESLSSAGFTVPPPASDVAEGQDFYSLNESMPPTIIPPPSHDYNRLIEVETQIRTAVTLSTPPVQACPGMYDVPDFPLDIWESRSTTVLQLFYDLGIDLTSLTETFRRNVQASNVFHSRHEMVLTMMLLRDTTTMMQAYLMEGTRPDSRAPLGGFLLEKLRRAKLRESLYPGNGSVDVFIQDASYDMFQQILTLMDSPLKNLEDVLKKAPSLNSLYELIIFNWEPER